MAKTSTTRVRLHRQRKQNAILFAYEDFITSAKATPYARTVITSEAKQTTSTAEKAKVLQQEEQQTNNNVQQNSYLRQQMQQEYYQNANCTMQQAFLLILTFILNFSLNGSQATALLDLLRYLLPLGAIVPKSLDNMVDYLLNFGQMRRTYYCHECRVVIPYKSRMCTFCNNESSQFFLYKPISEALQEKFQQHAFAQASTYYMYKYKASVGTISDIYDGSAYQQHCMPITAQGGLSLTITTDGISPYKHGSTQFWPIYGIINELPPSVRFTKEYMIFLGLWPTNTPDFQVFFSPMTEETQHLYEFGHNFYINGQYHNKKVVIGPSTLDMCAKHKVYGMKAFNGYFGCSLCLNQGENKNRKMYYPIRMENELFQCTPRDDDQTQEFCDKALETSEYYGHIDYSAFANFPTVGFVSHQALDWMHLVCLGVFRSILKLMINCNNHDEPYYVAKKEWKVIDSIWTANLFPSALQRHPRSFLKHFHHFKANEIRNFMFYGFQHCMKDILTGARQKYYDSTMKLVGIIKELDSTAISKDRLDEIEHELACWVLQFGDLYGEEKITINVHSLLHLAAIVRRWGPLWCYSMWKFEAENATLMKYIHGSNNKGLAASKMYLASQNLRWMHEQVTDSSFQTVLARMKSSVYTKSDEFVTVVPSVHVRVKDGYSNKAIINGRKITSKAFNNGKMASKDYVVVFWDERTKNDRYGRILKFDCKGGKWMAKIQVHHDLAYLATTIDVPVPDIKDVCVEIAVDDEIHIYKLCGNPELLLVLLLDVSPTETFVPSQFSKMSSSWLNFAF